MGFHVCEYCKQGEKYRYDNLSSGDTTLAFDSGRVYEVPDMVLHYVHDHQYRPPNDFVEDVMNGTLVFKSRLQTKSAPTRVGYLRGPFDKGEVPSGFIHRLEALLSEADSAGGRIQYRGKEEEN